MCKIHCYLSEYSTNTTQALFKHCYQLFLQSDFIPAPDSLSLCVSPPLVSVSCDCSVVSGAAPQLPAVQAPVFLLQPPHVINHVKWQKAQHCQDCEGDVMELKMGCFVVMQSILFHRRPACLLACLPSPCPQTADSSSPCVRYQK